MHIRIRYQKAGPSNWADSLSGLSHFATLDVDKSRNAISATALGTTKETPPHTKHMHTVTAQIGSFTHLATLCFALA